MIIFVGDEPSSKNVDPSVPFVGTKSYKTLLNWIADMDILIHSVRLVNKKGLTLHFMSQGVVEYRMDISGEHFYKDQVKVVALGENASKHLKKLKLNHFKLPHPSGLNRKLNDKKYVQKQLEQCKNYIND